MNDHKGMEVKMITSAADSHTIVSKSVRFTEIDGMRGLGASFVVFGHINIHPLFWVWTFMDMFFVISSFLITRIVLKQVVSFRGMVSFWGRRIERIWPLYVLIVWLSLVVAFAINFISSSQQFDLTVFWRFFTFSQFTDYLFHDFSADQYPYFTRHLWSLSVEEQFYILLPVMLLALRYMPRIIWMSVLLAVIPLAVWQRAVNANMWIITSHLDAFALGTLLAIGLQQLQDHRRLSNALLGIGFLVGLLWFLPYLIDGYRAYFAGAETPEYQAWPATAGVLAVSCCIGLLALNREARWLSFLRWPPLVYAGVISYGLYLVHYPIVRLAPKLVPPLLEKMGVSEPHPMLMTLITVAVCFGAAHVLYKFIDQRLQAGRGGAARAVPVPMTN